MERLRISKDKITTHYKFLKEVIMRLFRSAEELPVFVSKFLIEMTPMILDASRKFRRAKISPLKPW